MLKSTVVALLLVVLAGCGGLKITSLTAEQAEKAHKDGKVAGYIVYHPMLVVRLAETCEITGDPVVLPDYHKPFLLEIERGLGRSNVDLRIEDGWRFGGVKTEADNTALLKGAVAGRPSSGLFPKESKETCTPGFYKLIVKDKKVTFEVL